LAQKKNHIPVRTNPTPMRPKSPKTALLGMEVGGVTPAPGSTDRATRFFVRAARRTALGERSETVEGVRLRKEER